MGHLTLIYFARLNVACKFYSHYPKLSLFILTWKYETKIKLS